MALTRKELEEFQAMDDDQLQKKFYEAYSLRDLIDFALNGEKGKPGARRGSGAPVLPESNLSHIKSFHQLNEDRFTRAAHTDEQEESIETVVGWLKDMGKTPSKALSMPEVPLSWNPPILIDVTYQGGEIHIGWEGEIKVGGDEVDNFEDFKERLEDMLKHRG